MNERTEPEQISDQNDLPCSSPVTVKIILLQFRFQPDDLLILRHLIAIL